MRRNIINDIVQNDPGAFIFVRNEKDTIEDVITELEKFLKEYNIEPIDLLMLAVPINVSIEEDISKISTDIDQILAVYLLTSDSLIRTIFLIAAYKRNKDATFRDAYEIILEQLKKVPATVKIISKYYFENPQEAKK